jgi:hypothetical protein
MIRLNLNPSLIKAVKVMGNHPRANRQNIQNTENQANPARAAKEPKDTDSFEWQFNLVPFSLLFLVRRTPVVNDSCTALGIAAIGHMCSKIIHTTASFMVDAVFFVEIRKFI